MFKDKILLITGGTGSFGNAVLKRFLSADIKEIRIFSRDEKKQDDMRKNTITIKSSFTLEMFGILIAFAMQCVMLIIFFMQQH